MTYQIIYSSQSTMPMQSDDLEELLEHARTRNGLQGISGALVYTDGMFLQILEGENVKVRALMAKIRKDVRHEAVTILREGEIVSAQFGSWGMAYVGATPEQAASWAGIRGEAECAEVTRDPSEDLRRTAQFAQDILALLAPEKPGGPARKQDIETESGLT